MKHDVFFVRARVIDGLRSGRHRSLLAKMPKPNAKKRRVNRVKGFASRGFFRRWKWVLIPLVAFLLVPAMQVAVVRFVNPPRTLPMLIEQGGAAFSKAPKSPLLYRWIDLPQIPEMFLKHLWISEDQRFFQHERFGRGHSLLLALPSAPALPSPQALEELAVDDRRWNDA